MAGFSSSQIIYLLLDKQCAGSSCFTLPATLIMWQGSVSWKCCWPPTPKDTKNWSPKDSIIGQHPFLVLIQTEDSIKCRIFFLLHLFFFFFSVLGIELKTFLCIPGQDSPNKSGVQAYIFILGLRTRPHKIWIHSCFWNCLLIWKPGPLLALLTGGRTIGKAWLPVSFFTPGDILVVREPVQFVCTWPPIVSVLGTLLSTTS